MGCQEASPRLCLGCSVSIAHRHGNASRCELCSIQHKREAKKTRKRSNRKSLTDEQRERKRERDRHRARSEQKRASEREWRLRRSAIASSHKDHRKRGYRDICVDAPIARSAAERWRDYYRHSVRGKTIVCLVCGVRWCPVPGANSSHMKTCGDECREVRLRSARKKSKRGRRSRRWDRKHSSRARHYGSAVETVNRVSVFEAAGWRCASCGCATPRSLMGTTHQDAPELDHIVPLSCGGAHAMSNAQLLCRTCNALKGAMRNDHFMLWSKGVGGYRHFWDKYPDSAVPPKNRTSNTG